MRLRNSFTLLFVLLLVTAAGAQARTGNWEAVEKLQPGTLIFVEAGHHVRCVFEQATDRELVCDPAGPVPVRLGRMVYRFERRTVREVRLEHSDATNAVVGTAIGAGAGAAFGAARTNGASRGGGAILGALFGGVLGNMIGRIAPLFHGKVIYKR